MGNDYFRLNLSGSKESINIYGPPQTKEVVDAAFHYIAVSVRPFVAQNPAGYRMVNGDLVNPFAVHEFDHDGVIFQDDKVRVVAAENTHYSFLAPQDRAQIKSYSYRFETPHGVVVFTGDTGPSDAVARLAKGADVLVAEVTNRNAEEVDRLVNSMAAENHWPPARVRAFRAHMQMQHLDTNTVGQLAGQAKVKAVVLYHYVPRDKADAEGYVAEVRKSFSGPVFAPADLDRYCLQAKAGGSQPAAPLSACGKP